MLLDVSLLFISSSCLLQSDDLQELGSLIFLHYLRVIPQCPKPSPSQVYPSQKRPSQLAAMHRAVTYQTTGWFQNSDAHSGNRRLEAGAGGQVTTGVGFFLPSYMPMTMPQLCPPLWRATGPQIMTDPTSWQFVSTSVHGWGWIRSKININSWVGQLTNYGLDDRRSMPATSSSTSVRDSLQDFAAGEYCSPSSNADSRGKITACWLKPLCENLFCEKQGYVNTNT